MEITTKAVCLSAKSSPYKFAGNEGISNKIRFNVDGEIFSCNSTAEQVAHYVQFVQKFGEVTFKFSSPKEVLKLEVINFVED